MNILIVSQYFWPENFRVNDLAFYLRSRGHDVMVLTGLPNYPRGWFFPGHGIGTETHRGVEIKRVPLFPRLRGKGWQLACNYLSFSLSASLLGPFLCRKKFDVIFVHEPSPVTVGIPAIVMKKLHRVPIFFWALDLWPESLRAAGGVDSAWLLSLVRQMVRWIYRHCDRILVPSMGFVPKIESMGVNRGEIGFFPNWSENEGMEHTESGGLPAALPDGFIVMFAGNVGEAQDFPCILDAAEQLKGEKDIHWVILGDGRMLDWVQCRVEERELRQVHLIGRHPSATMPAFLSRADALLVTLKKDEIFALTVPAKVQAYLAFGRPVIAALDGEGARVVEESGAGKVVQSGDAAGLAEAVKEMSEMSGADRVRLGKNGKEYYRQNFSREILFNRLNAWMEEMTVTYGGKGSEG